MKKTTTSSFGTGKRESHDASAFYERSLYKGLFRVPLPPKELIIDIPAPAGWADRIDKQSAESLLRQIFPIKLRNVSS